MAGTSHFTGFFMTRVEKRSQKSVFLLAPGIGTGNRLTPSPTSERSAGSSVIEYSRAPITARKAPIPIDGMWVAVK